MKPIGWPEKKRGKMTVLNYKNTHFNLIVGLQHMLNQYGSLSIQAGLQKEKEDGVARRPVLQRAADSGQRQEETRKEFQEFAHNCNICKKGFTHKGNLFRHKKEHMDPKTPKMQAKPNSELKKNHNQFKFSGVKACDKCGAVFLSEALLMEHIKK